MHLSLWTPNETEMYYIPSFAAQGLWSREWIKFIKDIATPDSEQLWVYVRGMFWTDMHRHCPCSKSVQPMEPLGVQQRRTKALLGCQIPHQYASCLLNRLGRWKSEETLTLQSLSCLGAELLSPAQAVAIQTRDSPRGKCQCLAHWCVSTGCHSGT